MKLLILSLGFLFSMFTEKPLPYYHDIKPGKGCILLTFNGYDPAIPLHRVSHVLPYPCPDSYKRDIQERLAYYFKDWDVTITTEDSIFYTFPIDHRVRCVISNIRMDNGATYGLADSVGALRVGDTAAVVVSAIDCDFSNYAIATTAAHEVGHCLGLDHQSDWEYGEKIAEYGIGQGGKTPIMGALMNGDMAFWVIGCNREGIEQDDTLIISKIFRRLTPNELQNLHN